MMYKSQLKKCTIVTGFVVQGHIFKYSCSNPYIGPEDTFL